MARADRPCIPVLDIAQGEAGDCWFLSSLCSWATYVDNHDKMMLDKVICRMLFFLLFKSISLFNFTDSYTVYHIP